MKIAKTEAEVTNVNPRKEKGDNGDVLASDVSLVFAVPRETLNPLFPGAKDFLGQFFSEQGDTRYDYIYPICYGEKVDKLRATLHIGLKPMEFEGVRLAGMKFTPQVGGFVKVEAKLQVYPTRDQSGKLDHAVKEFIDLEVEPMTGDMLKAVA